MAYKDPEERRKAARRHYEANKPLYKQRAADHTRRHRAEVRRLVIEEKAGKPCTDCGATYPHYVMHFDHVGDDKLFNIGDAGSQGYAWSRIEEEIAKCELVCANCHAGRTWQRARSD